MKSNSIVFLYSEMAGYLVSSLKALKDKGYVIYVFHWPVNKEAPFVFEKIDDIHYIDRSNFDDAKLLSEISKINPAGIVCSGWMDKGYLRVIKKVKTNIPKIIALDNHWTGSPKQRFMQFASPFLLKKTFTHAWVAGEPQAVYARKLGFNGANLLDGFYSADLTFFKAQYKNNLEAKKLQFPKVFLYVGRYLRHKGIFEMWEAFISLKNETPNEWQLWCVGAGDEFDNRVEHESIKHFGFVQPPEMIDIISKAGVFVLPSHFEPWGVVVHEFAAAGMPLLLSKEIGAASAFLEPSVNGESFKANSVDELKNVMKNMMNKSDAELFEMSTISYKRSDWIDPDKWSEKLIQLL